MRADFMIFSGKPFAENLEKININCRRQARSVELTNGDCIVQPLAKQLRVISGSGILTASEAPRIADDMRELFYEGEEGILVIPFMRPFYAVLTKLELKADGEYGDSEYEFVFNEVERCAGGKFSFKHRVKPGENLWVIADIYKTTVERLVELNPLIARPDRLEGVEEVNVEWKFL